MHDKETKRNANVIEPSLCLAVFAPGRTLYVQAVILRNLILTLKYHIILTRLYMRGHYNSYLVSNERR